jgi:sulfur-carrier protein adenylyltransferase/sulfurtransferase
VGKLGLVDFDSVDTTNLHRQIIYRYDDVGQKKSVLAATKLKELNPFIETVAHDVKLNVDNVTSIFENYDIIVDCSDNFPTRYLINDACVLLKKTFVHGAIFQFDGQVSVFSPAQCGPCYRCLFPQQPPRELAPNCAQTGVLGVLPGIIGSLQASETIKWITGLGESAMGKLVTFDALKLRFESLKLGPDQTCPMCGTDPQYKDLSHHRTQPAGPHPLELSTQQVDELRQGGSSFQFIDIRQPPEQTESLPGAHLVLPEVLCDNLSNLAPRTETIVLYCQSGVRSLRLAELLASQGHHQIKSLAGGINAWKSQNLPVSQL